MTQMYSKTLAELLEEFLVCEDVPSSWALLTNELQGFGFDRAIYGRSTVSLPAAADRIDDAVIISNYSSEFMDFYMAERAYAFDPMLRWALANSGALSWGRVARQLERGELNGDIARTLEAFEALGHKTGYTYSLAPRRSGAGEVFGLCGIEGVSQDELDRIWAQNRAHIEGVLKLFSLSMQRLPERSGSWELSERQAEILRLVADGKSTRDVAVLLGLHRRTVEDHLSAVRRSIGAETTMHALAIAVRQGRV